MKKRILNIVGARPNFVKMAAILEEITRYRDIEPILVCTGQHYDKGMSGILFDELQIPVPDYDLKIRAKTQSGQIAQVMLALEPIIHKLKPDLVVVVGDVTSTLAAALTARKLGIGVAHVEAGLRSFDKEMPEEINRILTDHISDQLFVTEPSGIKNLKNEGINKNVYLVGNVMIDTLVKNKKKAIESGFIEKLNLDKSGYAILTLHRPSNVDSKESFAKILKIIKVISKKIKVVFPMHPRTKENAEKYNLNLDSVFTTGPLGYFGFINLVINAKFVLTDSGGIQEETTCLGIPCLTLRDNTERPITTELGTNILCGSDKIKILYEVERIMQGHAKVGKIPIYWDGKASQRIVKILAGNLN